MEEIGKTHQLQMIERERGTITGVVDVLSFNDTQIVLETTRGMLTVQGTELHVSRLQLQSGEVDVEGTVNSLVYTEGGAYRKRQRGSLVKRLFQ